VRELLLKTPSLRPQTRAALQMEKPTSVFWSVLENGKLALLNFSSRPATVHLANGRTIRIAPYEISVD